MRARSWLILALCLVSAAGTARADPGAGVARVKPAEAAGDAWVGAKVAAALLMDNELSIADMQVSTRDGRVRLSGVVHSDDEAQAAARIAWRVEGVHAVVNALSIRPALAAERP